MGSNFAFNWSFSFCLHILHCHLSHVHIFPKRGFFFVGRFKDLALDLIVREKMKQIRFSMRGWQLWLIEKGNQPNKVFFRGKTNPHTDGNICFQYYIIILHLFLESFVHPSQMMWWYVTILIRVLGVLQPVCPVSVGVGLASRCHFSKKQHFQTWFLRMFWAKVSKSDIKMNAEVGFFECSPGLEIAPFLSKDAMSLPNPLPALLSY